MYNDCISFLIQVTLLTLLVNSFLEKQFLFPCESTVNSLEKPHETNTLKTRNYL